MARYQGQVAVFRATVPLGVQDRPTTRSSRRPSSISYTAQEVAGTRPRAVASCAPTSSSSAASRSTSPARCRRRRRCTAFVADKDPNKRDKLVDRLLETPEYAYYFANKWADILRVKRRDQPDRANGTFAFHDWIREAIADDKPYDQFVREILGRHRRRDRQPADGLVQGAADSREQFVDDTAQVFLGLRLACAQCHHHPYEKWSQDDYWGLAAFFGRVGRKNVAGARRACSSSRTQRQVDLQPGAAAASPTSGPARPAVMKPLDGEPMEVGADDDPRQKLVDWMVDAEEPVLRPGRGQSLLGALLRPRHRRSARRHARHQPAVATPSCSTRWPRTWSTTSSASSTWSRRSARAGPTSSARRPNEFNKHDKQTYARYYPRRHAAPRCCSTRSAR